MRGWKKLFHANGNQKKAGVAILVSDKINFKIKTVIRDKEGHYVMIKGSIQEEDITIVNMYAPNIFTIVISSSWIDPLIIEEDIKIVNIYAPKIGGPQYIRQMLTAIKGKLTVTQS